MKISGIYKIVNKINGKYYIGSSDDIDRRWYQHRILLRNGYHENKYLQKAWNKYGENSFDFILIEQINESNLLEIEQKYLQICNRKISYNLTYDSKSPMKGIRHSKKSKDKISKANTGRKHSKKQNIEHGLKMKGKYSGKNNPMYGIKRFGKENPMYGRKHTEETKNKIRLSLIKKHYESKH